MKNLKNIALVFAAALITFGATAQTAATPVAGKTKTETPVVKEKTKTVTKPNGTVKTVTKTKPTEKVNTVTTKTK